MISYNKKRAAILIFTAAFFVSLDRLLKMIALRIYPDQDLPLVGEILQFNFVKNYNIAFSLPLSGLILIVVNLLIIIALLYGWLIFYRKQQFLIFCGLTFLIFGAISNMLDRIKFGFVIDYIDLKYFTVFNIADMMIVGGAVLFVGNKIFYRINYERENS